MKSKSEITQEYIDMLNDRLRNMEEYKDYLTIRQEKILELSSGNRGIEEIEEELEKMINLINQAIDLTEDYKRKIGQNEFNFY